MQDIVQFMQTYASNDKDREIGSNSASHIPAHEEVAVAAPFQA